MKEEDKKRLEEIIAGMDCPKGFKCVELGFERLCKAKALGFKDYVKCLDDNLYDCSFALPFEDVHLCQCPLRVYVSNNLVKHTPDKDARKSGNTILL